MTGHEQAEGHLLVTSKEAALLPDKEVAPSRDKTATHLPGWQLLVDRACSQALNGHVHTTT